MMFRNLLGYALDMLCRLTRHRWCHVLGAWSYSLLDMPTDIRIDEHF